LTVTDNCGAANAESVTVSVSSGNPCTNNTPPTADAGPDKSGVINTPVTFDASASSDPGGQIVSYWWTFGDGAVTNWQPNAIVEHAYTKAGSYPAQLWVRDDCGLMSKPDTAEVQITAQSGSG
ncbi:MAG: PKD domain-containing protein, partial [Candidatus Omnitrophica bacterium]|nr:PKD domain-containing protein [Candidatus Omnitrophota bacterium]